MLAKVGLDPQMNVMSIDVEDWYHCLDFNPDNWGKYEHRIVDNTLTILDILELTNTKATFFVLGHVAENHPDLVKEIYNRGHEIGTHVYFHCFIYEQTKKDFEKDVYRSIELLSNLVREPIRSYRAPCFSITKSTDWAFEILSNLGIEFDSSIFPVINHRYGNPDAHRLPYYTEEGILEAPISTYPLKKFNIPIGGGVYFRFFLYYIYRNLLSRL